MPEQGLATVPVFISLLMRPLPLRPLETVLAVLTARLAARNGAMFARLGVHADKVFGIVPTDMPFAFVLRPAQGRVGLKVLRRLDTTRTDAVICGTLKSLVVLAEGRADGDALFFSRQLTFEGDVEAILALRNAIDDARLDITAELMAPLGPLAKPARTILREIAGWISTPGQHKSDALWS
jgi:predicted lipid carrier protein YhbT